MARDDRKDGKDGKAAGKDEDYEFVPPDFDEDSFIHREMVSFRTTTILFVWGILAALVSWALFGAVQGRFIGWGIGLAIAAAFGLALRWIFPRLKADIKHFGRREWLGTAFLFFFTWLAFFIIAVNPPISDYAAPRVDLVAGPLAQQEGGDVVVDAFFEDNDRVTDHELTITGPDGPVTPEHRDEGRGHHVYTVAGARPGLYQVEASATDRRGHTASDNLTFAVVEQALAVDLPDGDRLDEPTDAVTVDVAGQEACTKKQREDCVRTVYLEIEGGSRVVLEFNRQVGRWIAYPNHAGWSSGPVAFTAVAEFVDTYSGHVRIDGGSVRSGPHALNVSAALGDYVPAIVNDPGPPARSVPGLGVPLLAVALLGLVLLARRD